MINLEELVPTKINNTIAGKYVLIYGKPKIGKAQPVDTLIPTPSGSYVRMGDLKANDYVFDRHGYPTRVLDVFPQGKLKNFRVTFEDGTITYCNDEHLWSYYTSTGDLKTSTLAEMVKEGITITNANGKEINQFLVPAAGAVGYTKKLFQITPYTMGERSIDVKEKGIPCKYKIGSISQRFSLLQGIFDSYGDIDERTLNIKITNLGEVLIKDIQEVLRSLGIHSSIDFDCEGKVIFTNISHENKLDLFYAHPKKKILLNTSTNAEEKYDRIAICAVEEFGEEEMVCILVDNEEHLYLTNDYIVTHNTSLAVQFPSNLLLAVEKGYNAIPNAMVVDIDTWGDLKTVVAQLDKDTNKEKFKTITIDTVADSYDLCEKFICQKHRVKKIGDIPYGAGYAECSKEFNDTLKKITKMGYGLVMIAHAKETVTKDDDGEVIETKVFPNIAQRPYNIVNQLVDIIGYINADWAEDGVTCNRSLITRGTKSIVAGSRFEYLKPVIEFSYASLEKELAIAIDKKAEEAGVEVVKTKVDLEKEGPSFEELSAKSKEIWETLMGEQVSEKDKGENFDKIQKEIVGVFGEPIRLSEIAPDQCELFELLVNNLSALI